MNYLNQQKANTMPNTERDGERIPWPENIVADRHEVSGKWVLHYLTDEQANKCAAAMSQPATSEPAALSTDAVKFSSDLPEKDLIQALLRVEYKYFGEYEFSDGDWDAVNAMTNLVWQYLAYKHGGRLSVELLKSEHKAALWSDAGKPVPENLQAKILALKERIAALSPETVCGGE